MKINELLNRYELEDLFLLEGISPEEMKEYNITSNICSESVLVQLHNDTKLLFPSYFLRYTSFENIKEMTEKTLNVLLESGSNKAYQELKNIYKNDLSKASDEFLVIGAQNKGVEESNLLAKIYEPIITKNIKKIIRGYFFRGQVEDDLIQEGFIGFLKAIEVYKIERRTKFREFTKYVIERHLGTLLNRSRNLRNKALNTSFSYNMPVNSNNETTFEELIEGVSISPDEITVNREMCDEIWEKLTENEQEVLKYYANGLTYERIAYIFLNNKKVIDFKGMSYREVSSGVTVLEPINLEIYKAEKAIKKLNEKIDELKEMIEDENCLFENPNDLVIKSLFVLEEANLKLEKLKHERSLHIAPNGITWEKIALELKRMKKSVDNTIQRIRNKGKTHLAKEIGIEEEPTEVIKAVSRMNVSEEKTQRMLQFT